MNRLRINIRRYGLCLLLCFLQVAGLTLYAQNQSRAASKRQHPVVNDSTARRPMRPIGQRPSTVHLADSLQVSDSLQLIDREAEARAKAIADSVAAENRRKMLELTAGEPIQEQPIATDSLNQAINRKVWVPNPTKATWLALIFPGGGQIYNRKYWKLPIFYGGFAGCAYALSWNNKMYKDDMSAYKDAANNRWDSSSITDLLPPGYINRVSKTQLTETLRKRKDTYRRYRDLSIFAFIGVYLLSVVDAYVDAELSNFDITPDLSMRLEPAVIDVKSSNTSTKRSVGLQCSFRF